MPNLPNKKRRADWLRTALRISASSQAQLGFRTVCLVMRFHSLMAVMFGVEMVRVRDVRMMCCLFMMASRVMFGCLFVVLCSVLVVLSSLRVMFVCHRKFPSLIVSKGVTRCKCDHQKADGSQWPCVVCGEA